MEPWQRESDVMDVLKDITDGLRTGDTDETTETTSETDETATTGTDTQRNRESRSPQTESPQSADPGEYSDSDRGDSHLCSFCETEFDAGRDTCPECDAEIVLRGAR